MPLIKPEDTTPLLDFKCKLRADELEDLRLYGIAIESSEAYVVSQALRQLFADKVFQTWKAENKEKLMTGSEQSKAKRGPKVRKGEL